VVSSQARTATITFRTLANEAPLYFASTVAGSGSNATVNATGLSAGFNTPTSSVADPITGNIYVADRGSHIIRMINIVPIVHIIHIVHMSHLHFSKQLYFQ
jgi:hypothetical protein